MVPKADKRKTVQNQNRDKHSEDVIQGKKDSGKQAQISYGHPNEVDKEIIRRLRIQNKKLMEQVMRLKEEIKNVKIRRVEALVHLNALMKLINH